MAVTMISVIVFCAVSSRKRKGDTKATQHHNIQSSPVENGTYSEAEAATPLLGGPPDTWLYFKKTDCKGICSSASVGRSVVAGFLLLKNCIALILFGLLHHELKTAASDVTLG